MVALYIHIPYCLQKCAYCDFCSFTDLASLPDYLRVLVKELKTYASIYKNSIINTIYLGGGTPSLLAPDQLRLLLDAVRENFQINSNVECTVELNPETVTRDKATQYQKLGVNRVSLGVQSFDEGQLRYLGRIHDSARAKQALTILCDTYQNVSIDLMSSLPGQDILGWKKELAQGTSYPIQHISCYELTVEQGTPLAERYIPQEQDPEIFNFTKKYLEDKGFIQYEISNYSKPGFESKHNLAYWSDESYLGVGLAAHSYEQANQKRWANTEDMAEYLQGNYVAERTASHPDQVILMGLRKNNGVAKKVFSEKQLVQINKCIADGLLLEINGQICLSDQGRPVMDFVLRKLI